MAVRCWQISIQFRTVVRQRSDIRVFKDVRPAADGKVHLGFRSDWGRAFVSALELTPGTSGKIRADPDLRLVKGIL